MEKDTNDIDDLIGKVLTGEASTEEQLRLEVWTKLSTANHKHLEQVKAIFEKAASHQVQLHFDTDAAWKKVKEKLSKSATQEVRFLPFFTNKTLLRMAAGVIFILGATFFAYEWWNIPTETLAVIADATTVQDTLPDGSTAFLNKKSSITYEYNPRQKTRKVKLKGEGFFEVKHENEKPFVVEAQEVLIRDIGTAFNVKAYPNSDTVLVTVKTGEVQIYTLNNEGISLKMGEAGIYRKSLHEFSRLEKPDTNALSYKTGVLSFNNTDLKTVISKINEVYNSKIKLENPALASCRLTVNFHNEPLDTIVDVIAETLKLTVTRKNKEILLNGPGCN